MIHYVPLPTDAVRAVQDEEGAPRQQRCVGQRGAFPVGGLVVRQWADQGVGVVAFGAVAALCDVDQVGHRVQDHPGRHQQTAGDPLVPRPRLRRAGRPAHLLRMAPTRRPRRPTRAARRHRRTRTVP